MKSNQPPQVDLGLLAMPLFCSLLGAILILMLGNLTATPLPLPREKIQELAARLTQARLALAQSVSTQTVISNRLDLAEYRAANATLEEELAKLRRQVSRLTNEVTEAQIRQGHLEELRRQAESGAADVAAARERLRDLEARSQAATTNAALGLLGGYRGSLVLIECDAQGYTIHPGGRRLALSAPEREFDPVFTAVEQAGFVALVARPGGFAKTYDRAHKIVTERLESMNRGRQTAIGLCAFPLDADAPLTAFLPKGVTQ